MVEYCCVWGCNINCIPLFSNVSCVSALSSPRLTDFVSFSLCIIYLVPCKFLVSLRLTTGVKITHHIERSVTVFFNLFFLCSLPFAYMHNSQLLIYNTIIQQDHHPNKPMLITHSPVTCDTINVLDNSQPLHV